MEITAIALVISGATKDIGVCEVPRGSNRGARVEQMLATTGLGGGNPWCAAAVATWGFETLGKAWPLPKSADCDVLLDFARRHKILHSTPQAGDIFLVLASQNDATHTGLVIGVDEAGSVVQTIEGNSNAAGGREGYEVAKRNRPVTPRLVFVRWADLITGDANTGGWTLYLGDKRMGQVDLLSGSAYYPARALLNALFGDATVGKALMWDDQGQCLAWNGKPIPAHVVRRGEGTAWAQLRPFAASFGLDTVADGEKRAITLRRPSA